MATNLGRPSTRAVFFDLAGTLIKVRGGIGAQYSAIARDYGVEADAAAIDVAFPGAFASADSRRGTDPQILADSRRGADPQRADSRRFHGVSAEVASLEKGFWKEVVRLVFAEAGGLGQFRDGQFDRYFDRLFDYFATSAGWTIYPDVVPVLGDLKRRGFILGLITNFDHRVFTLVDALELACFIDSITIPALAGAAKPERAIFGYALARHGLQASEAVQVGDSIRDDVEGACAAGLRGVLVDRRGRSTHPAGIPTISSLDHLLSILPLISGRL